MPRRHLVLRGCAVALAVSVAVPVGAARAEPLVPGDRWTTTVDLPGPWAEQADRLGVSVVQLRQLENGCTRPETRAGDLTCGDDEGDLAGQLVATVAAGRQDGDACVPTTAALPLDLAGATTTRLAVTGPECLVVVLDFPDGDDDDLAQSDSLAFTLSMVAGGPGDGVEAGGGVHGGTTGTGSGGGTGTAGGPVSGGGGTAAGGAATRPGTGSADRTAGTVGAAGALNGAAGSPNGSPGSVNGSAGTSDGTDGTAAGAAGAGRSGGTASAGGAQRGGAEDEADSLGATTADLEVGADSTAEAGASRTLLGDPVALGALLLGATTLFWVLFLVLRRRRREQP